MKIARAVLEQKLLPRFTPKMYIRSTSRGVLSYATKKKVRIYIHLQENIFRRKLLQWSRREIGTPPFCTALGL